MGEHPIQALMTTAMENLKEMIDVNTIVGDPVETPDGGIILTVSKVGFGFATGGSDFQGSNRSSDSSSNDESSSEEGGKYPFGGGSGGGVSITPIAFLVVNKDDVKILHLEQHTHLYEKILDIAPAAIEKIQQFTKKNDQEKKKGKDDEKKGENLDFNI